MKVGEDSWASVNPIVVTSATVVGPSIVMVEESTVTTAPAAEPRASADAPTRPRTSLRMQHLRNLGRPFCTRQIERCVYGSLTLLFRLINLCQEESQFETKSVSKLPQRRRIFFGCERSPRILGRV